MKFSLTIYTKSFPNGRTFEVGQYASRLDAAHAEYPDALSVTLCTSLVPASVFVIEDRFGGKFVAVVTDIYDGSETELANALGRDLTPADMGKDSATLIQSDDYRREAVRD